MIVDGFNFYNEVDMLQYRLEYLYDHVDYFVISECNLTYAGNPKPLNFLLNFNRFEKYRHKILYCPLYVDRKKYNFDVTVTQCDFTTDFWTLERQQRQNIMTAIAQFDDDTVVMISDLDEIPNIDVLPAVQAELKHKPAVAFVQQSFYYNLKYRHPNYAWPFPAAGTKKVIADNSVDWLRSCAMQISPMLHGGWHLSYFMTPEQIKNKLQNFSHQEFNHEHWTNENRILTCMQNNRDPLDRFYLETPSREEFPEHFLRVFGKFY
jgi:beta-1,4-mannosyl-glycoprotein beta-1,4-N-acetylglucosaminyltransferase